MNRRLALLTGGIAVGLAALWRVVARRPAPAPLDAAPDPRAQELRQRLDEARTVADDREEFEGAETPVDEAQPLPPQTPDDRRRAIHAEGRSAAERMREPNGEG